MNKHDVPVFKSKLFLTLGKYPSFKPDETTLACYWDELKDYDLEAVISALTKAPLACTNKEFAPSAPTIASIAQALQTSSTMARRRPTLLLTGDIEQPTASALGDRMGERMEVLMQEAIASKGEFTHSDGLQALKNIQQDLFRQPDQEKRTTLPQGRRQPIARYQDDHSPPKTQESVSKKVLEPLSGLVDNALRTGMKTK